MHDGQTESAPARTKKSRTPWLLILCLLGLVAGLGAFAFHAGKALIARNAELEREAQESEAEVARLQQLREGMERRLKALGEQGASLETEKQTLAQQLAEKDAQLAQLQATFGSLEQRLQEEIKRGEVKVTQSEGRVQVDLVDKILFASGEAALSPRGEEVLTRVGSVLSQMEERLIQVAGHTDDSPPSEKLQAVFPTNWELSVARAVNVVRFLTEKANVPSRRMVAAGHGEFQPVAFNATPEGRARNRRIEILLLPPLKATPATLAAAPKAPVKKPSPKPAVAKKTVKVTTASARTTAKRR